MPNDEPTVIERHNVSDSAIIGLLMLEISHRPWSVDEVAREMGEDVTDSLNRLYGGGLIHRLDGFVWASRAATMAEDIRM